MGSQREGPSSRCLSARIAAIPNLPISIKVLMGVENPASVANCFSTIKRGMQDKQIPSIPQQSFLMLKRRKVKARERLVVLQDAGLKEGKPQKAFQVITYWLRPSATQPKSRNIERPVGHELREPVRSINSRDSMIEKGPSSSRWRGHCPSRHGIRHQGGCQQSSQARPNVQVTRGQPPGGRSKQSLLLAHTTTKPQGDLRRCSEEGQVPPHAGSSKRQGNSAISDSGGPLRKRDSCS